MADVHSATMMGRRRNPSHWVFTCLSFVGLNWPLLLLCPSDCNWGKFKTTLVLCLYDRLSDRDRVWRLEANTDWKCDAGSVGRYSIASDDRRDRICRTGETYERAIDNEMLSLSDAASVKTDAFSVADPFLTRVR